MNDVFASYVFLPKTSLPCITKVFNFSYQSIMLHVKTQLSKLVSSQSEFLSRSTIGHCFKSLRNLTHVFRFPIFGMKDNSFTLVEVNPNGILQGSPSNHCFGSYINGGSRKKNIKITIFYFTISFYCMIFTV